MVNKIKWKKLNGNKITIYRGNLSIISQFTPLYVYIYCDWADWGKVLTYYLLIINVNYTNE